MKKIKVFLTSLILLILIQKTVYADYTDFSKFDRSSEMIIIVYDEKNVFYEEKMTIENNLNQSANFSAWFPLTWPCFVDKTEYSILPYDKWEKPDENSIKYVNASEIQYYLDIIEIDIDESYLKSIKTYPEIPGIVFQGRIEKNKKTGFAMRTDNPSGLIEEKNGFYSLYIGGWTEGETESILIKIPREIQKYWFLNAELVIKNITPSFYIDDFEPNYQTFRWDDDFLVQYFDELGRDITMNEIRINYTYEIPLFEYITKFIIFLVGGIALNFFGIGFKKVINKRKGGKPEELNKNESQNKTKKGKKKTNKRKKRDRGFEKMTELRKFEEQWERVKRWYNIFHEITFGSPRYESTDYYQDVVYAFFINCYHLRDWIIKDKTVELKDKKQKVDNFIRSTTCLRICRDLCNGTKHLELDISRSSTGTQPEINKREISVELGGGENIYSINFKMKPIEGYSDAFVLATDCKNKWHEFIKNEID